MSKKLLLILVVSSFFQLAQAAGNTAQDQDTVALTDRVSIKKGDVILSINGKKMKNNMEALSTIGSMKNSSRIEMEVLRENKIKKLVFDAKK